MWKWILFIRKNLLPLAKMEIIMFWDSPLPSSNRCRELRLVNISTNRMAIQKYGDKDFHLSIKSYWNVYHLTPQITSQTNYQNRQYFQFHPKELNYVKYWTFFEDLGLSPTTSTTSLYTFESIVMARTTRSWHGLCDVIQQLKRTTFNNVPAAAASSIKTGTKTLPSSLQTKFRASWPFSVPELGSIIVDNWSRLIFK